jgi:hypothetical protein
MGEALCLKLKLWKSLGGITNGLAITNFSIIYANGESTFWVSANPSFKTNGCSFPAVIGQRYQNPGSALLAFRKTVLHIPHLPKLIFYAPPTTFLKSFSN